MKIIEKVIKDTGKNYKRLIRDYCPEKFGYKNCRRVSGACSMDCKECWNRELINNGIYSTRTIFKRG